MGELARAAGAPLTPPSAKTARPPLPSRGRSTEGHGRNHLTNQTPRLRVRAQQGREARCLDQPETIPQPRQKGPFRDVGGGSSHRLRTLATQRSVETSYLLLR